MSLKNLLSCCIASYTLILMPILPCFAYEFPDIVAPRILHQPLNEPSVALHPIEMRATIIDNDAVYEAILFYRAKGKLDYSNLKMNSHGQGVYVAMIPEKDDLGSEVEYYIQASDNTGNIVLQGSALTPIVMRVMTLPLPKLVLNPEKELAPATEPFVLKAEAEPIKPWYKKRWAWTIAAVVIGGAVAANANNRNTEGRPTGNVVIDLPSP